MSIAGVTRGWQFFMHPGPTNIPLRVLQAMARPAVDFTGPEFVALRDRSLERLAADKAHAIKAVMLVQNETATGTRHSVAEVRAAMNRARHDRARLLPRAAPARAPARSRGLLRPGPVLPLT